ncbi:SWI/SNF-related matrix-associated actin-dependent regulator of chromatin subfamily A-like protein 1 isoform X2 [Eucalyptus grandis]|uniref:SWI/SNF-related matrix-associated actin-dependent regulator of chromatin subfamily A-like protein 1 isoform X2 n=1 Tax=Eucalyptus grandis TaxID=71139 RepID=UPI00192E9FE8|nr:SWI/SNF-related matrix-associated actin-dependent regulator of chromatin subfamily A-like protein 1 isoform X2 [Eucalyptus grandis]
MDDDDWDLSAEDLDSLERDALQQLSRPRDFPGSQPRSPVPAPSSAGWNSTRVVPDSWPYKGEDLPAPSRACADELGKELLPKSSVKFYLHSSGNVAAKFQYDQVIVAAFRKIPKASWNAKERIWMFPLSSLPSKKVLAEERGCRIEIVNLDPLVCRAIAAASALPDLQDRYGSMPSDVESKLLPFQRDGVRFVLQHGIRVLIADEMGLGKTLQAIAVATCVRDSWPVLVLTPSSLRLHWATMIQQWLNIPSSDILLVIADESHFLKNAQAKRTTATLPVIKKAQYAMLLSGTPALSRPIELHKQLEALYPDVYKNVHEYGQRYCKGGFFGVYQGASNHEELHNLMKATVMIRRLKREVLTQLPVKRRQQVFLDLADKDMKRINALFRELKGIKERIKACTSKEEAESLKFSEKNLINKIYTDSAEAKIPAVLDYLETVVEAGCKFLIFAHHQPMMDAIHEFLLKKKVGSIRIDGSTPAVARQALVTDFQEKDAIKAAVLSIRAGGVGLTLTAASTVIFAELSWTPGDLIQAEDRAHRIGQVSSVNIYYLLANDTVDDIIWDVVQNKLENLGQVLDGHENTLEVSASQPTRNSPAKQKTFNSPGKQHTLNSPGKQQTFNSPGKQTTLDSFVKRCNSGDPSEHQPKLKFPRH